MKGSDLTTQTNIVTSTAVPSTVPAEQVESCCSKFDNTKPLRLGLKNHYKTYFIISFLTEFAGFQSRKSLSNGKIETFFRSVAFLDCLCESFIIGLKVSAKQPGNVAILRLVAKNEKLEILIFMKYEILSTFIYLFFLQNFRKNFVKVHIST